MLRDTLDAVLAGRSLGEDEAAAAMGEMMGGESPSAQVAAFLTALRMKGETIDEITGFARGMRAKALQVTLPEDVEALDTCGTGGDRSGTFNISTAAAFVVAATGQMVAKHGNRAATSKCGSADVLEALGAQIDLPPEAVARCVAETGFGFMYAPSYHPSMKYVIPIRRELGFRTVFNILGPLTNPAGVRRQVLGVPDQALVRLMAEALLRLGTQRAIVVHGDDGLDEISLTTTTHVAEVNGADGTITEYVIDPSDLGLDLVASETLVGGDAKANANLLRGILAGEISGAPTDVVCLNAGAALYVADKANSIREGIALAREQLRPDRAMRALGAYVALSQDLAIAAEREAVRAIQGK